MFPNLYSMWKDAFLSKKLPQEWLYADDFLTWATKNGYKPEYGYEGDFTPENCLAAIPHEDNIIMTGIDLAGGPDRTVYPITESTAVDALMKKMKLPELRQLAANLNLNIGDADTKREIAEIIVKNSRKTSSESSGGS